LRDTHTAGKLLWYSLLFNLHQPWLKQNLLRAIFILTICLLLCAAGWACRWRP